MEGEILDPIKFRDLYDRWIHSAYIDDLETMESLITQDVDINFSNSDGLTALLIATYNSHTDIVLMLLKQHNINVNIMNLQGYSPLSYAVCNGNIEMVRALRNNAFLDINSKNKTGGHNALMLAVKHDQTTLETLLSDPRINVNDQDDDGNTALHLAAEHKHVYSIRLLLQHPDINIEIKNKSGQDFITRLGHKELSNSLRNYDMQKNIINNRREDIIVFLDNYKFVNERIKRKYPELFKAKEWGLV